MTANTMPQFADPAAGVAFFNAQLKQLAIDAKEFGAQLQQMANSFAQSVRSMVSTGFAGTQELARFQLAWQQLCQQVASLFIPVLNQLTLVITEVTQMFRGLSGHGQSMLATFAGLAGVILQKISLLGILRTVFSMIGTLLAPMTLMWAALLQGLVDFLTGTAEGQMIMGAVGDAMKILGWVLKTVGEVVAVVADALTVAFQGIVRAMNWVVIKVAGLIEAILDWVPGLSSATEAVRQFRENAQANLDRMVAGGWGATRATTAARSDVTPGAARFEDITAAFERVVIGAARVGPGPEQSRHEEQIRAAGAIVSAVDGVRGAVERGRPAVGR